MLATSSDLGPLACPLLSCGGALRASAPVLASCDRCEAPYPVLAGVPVLTPSPGAWLASYRDAVLATLAERGLADPDVVALVDTFAAPFASEEPLRFGDDWTAHERAGEPPPDPVAGSAAAELLRELASGAHASPDDAILDALGGTPGRVLEIGPGAGTLTRKLARADREVWTGDLSLRAVLLARTPETRGVVLDAQALPVAADALDAIVAANVLDLLDDPDAFLDGAADALRPGGRLVLSAPEDLAPLLADHPAFEPGPVRDAVPWVRAHDPRRFDVYLVQIASATRLQ